MGYFFQFATAQAFVSEYQLLAFNTNLPARFAIAKQAFLNKIFWADSYQAKNSDRLFPSRYLLVQSQQWKYQNNVWNLFKVNNKETRTMNDVIDIFLKSLLLTLSRFSTFFWCLYDWLSASKCWLVRGVVLLIWI